MKAQSLLAAVSGLIGLAAATPAVAQNFTGPRIEGRAGYNGTNISIKDQRDFGGRGDFSSGSTESDLSFGGEAGFDMEAGRLAFGGYAGFDMGDNEETFPLFGVNFETSRNITAGGRIGYVVSPKVLVYAKGGYSNARIRVRPRAGATAAQMAAFASFDEDTNGLHAGGGVEFTVRGGFYGRFDFAHHKYESFQVDVNNEFSFRRNTLTAAIGLRF